MCDGCSEVGARIKRPASTDVPDGWFVVNPRHMAELRGALDAVGRVRRVIDGWRDTPICGTTNVHEEEVREAMGGES